MSLNLKETEFSASTDSPPDDDSPKPVSTDAHLEFTAGRHYPESVDLDGFNEYGVRENRAEDGELVSVDVVYEAMEPGPPEDRNGVRITDTFLRKVAEKNYSGQEPYMLGHSDRPLDEIGKVQKVWFEESVEKLMLMNRVFNTGAPTHDEVVKRLTYTPPTMTDGSVGFGNQYEAVVNDDGEPELIDGQIREFSTVPFPGGYDEGGLGLPSAAFAESIMEQVNAAVDDEDEANPLDVGESSENSAFSVRTETISF
ncbi:prohead protease Pro [Halophage HF1]|uniref:Prohead protease Pro n=1 Tax=Halophage HF1 TaxID=2847106 RepID=Q7TDF1_9CAUD|nr:head maturation protease [Halophage HF1]AAO61390.1 prohead protease Pro [Halophage HF1]